MGDIRLRKRPAPLPPMWAAPASPAIERSPLAQFVILSMLLHALFILLFGAPSGGSREGRAMWGSMQVLLTGPPRDPEPVLKIDRTAPVLPKAPAPAPPALEPSVAREIERTAAPPVKPAQPIAIPPLLDRIVTPEPRLQMSPILQLPLPAEGAPQPPPPPVEAQPAPIEIPAPLVAPPAVTLPMPLETPALPALRPTPPVERAPVEVPALPAPALETLAPMSPTQVREFDRIEPRLPPVRVEPAPTPQPTLRTEPVEAPPRVEPAPAVRPEPAPAVRTEPAPSRPEPAPATRAAPVEAPSLFKTPAADDRGANRYDPTAPSVDLDAIRHRAGELGRQGTGNRALLPFPMPPVPDRKTKMETAIENARKPDCRKAYADLGLAAIVPLIANEFGEGKCRW